MGSIVVLAAFIIEAAFAAYCITTKSSHRRVRYFMRIGALAAFVFLIAVSVIHWSFRWYALAVLLLIWAALGVWALVRKKAAVSPYKGGPVIGRAIGTLLLVFLTLVPVLVFPQTRLPAITGEHPVATVKYTYTDQNRIETFTDTGEHREVNVEFWYPGDGGGPYPLVVFSHGTAGVKTSNTSTFMDLASNGYVVCSIDHPYHSLFTVDASGRRTMIDRSYLQQYLDFSNGKYDAATKYRLEQEWMGLRIADINFVLDTILARVKDSGSGAVYRLIDPEKIGLMGHSLGGESSAQVARERNDIAAVVNLDADLGGEYVDFVDGKEVLNDTVYPVPILSILSDALARPIAAIPDAQDVVAVEHVTATAPHAYEIHLAGTNHMSMTDLALTSPFLVSLIDAAVPKAGGQAVNALGTTEKINAMVLAFFNAYLKGKGTFTTAGIY
jgi:dienelactone hydrolase